MQVLLWSGFFEEGVGEVLEVMVVVEHEVEASLAIYEVFQGLASF